MFDAIEFHLISHHRRPLKVGTDLLRSMDKETWMGYLCSIVTITFIFICFGIYIGMDKIRPTHTLIGMAMILLEPYNVALFKGVKSMKMLVIICLLMAVSFNWFFNMEFRSSIIAQKFPDDIEQFEQVDILRHGLYIPMDYLGL